jgi:hypothetical protein
MDTEIRGELELLKKQVTALNANVATVTVRLEPLEDGVSSWAASTAALGEDVKQRFRVVNERLTEIERRLAA